MKEFKHDGETFLLDDSQGCYVAVYHAEREGEPVGYVGVALNGGTDMHPYAATYWSSANRNWAYGNRVTPDGLEQGGRMANIESGLEWSCQAYLNDLRELRGREAFKPEAACEALHKYVGELPDQP